MKAPSFGVLLVAAFAVGTGLNGLYTGVTDLPTAPNTLALIVGVTNIVMGITGLAAAVLLWRQHRLAVPLVIAWGASATALSILAPRAYASDAGWPAAIAGGLVTGAVVVAIVLYVRWRLALTALGKSSPAS